jgi:3-hydroxyisobutyrate dehydrogenase-like beta-hydroxyacid dehydrogenase
MSLRAGFIGLGNIGRPMAERLLHEKLETTVFDVDAQAVRELQAMGARAASSCADVARQADVVGVCVRDDAEVRAVVSAADGVLAGAAKGAVIALHSTILPSTVRAIAAAAAKQEVAVVDAPITGGAIGAQQGKLCCIAGGDAEAIERCRPFFEAFASKIVHAGPLGCGAAVKLCNNLIGYLGFLAAFEATLLADSAGLPFEALDEVTRHNGVMTDQMRLFVAMRRNAAENEKDEGMQAMLRRFTDLAEKDLAVALAFAREHGVALPGAALCQQLMARVYGIADPKRR